MLKAFLNRMKSGQMKRSVKISDFNHSRWRSRMKDFREKHSKPEKAFFIFLLKYFCARDMEITVTIQQSNIRKGHAIRIYQDCPQVPSCMNVFLGTGIEFEDESRLKLEVSALLLLSQKIDTHFSDFLQSPNCQQNL